MNFIRRLSNTKNSNLGFEKTFNKTTKYFFKKRMGLNHLDLQKLTKIDIDHDSMTERNDWFDEGSDVQSHFYHELLFNVISKIKIKIQNNLLILSTTN